MPKLKKLTKVSIVLFIAVFAITAFILSKNYVAPILMYHSVHPDSNPNNRLEISVASFERQMQFLKKHNYNVVTVEELSGLIRERKRIPPRTVAITFDDGYKDNYTYAFPVLKKYKIPATMFVIINEIGRPQADRLSWDQIKTMLDSGLVTFGSHAIGPEPLTNIYSSRAVKSEISSYFKNQIFNSKKILEEKLGREITVFSYPEGRFNGAIRKLVIEAGYKAAVATNPGKKFPDDDIFALKRLRISSTCDSLLVFWIESSGFYNFIREMRHK